MELRNRRLSGEGQSDAEEDVMQAVDTSGGVDGSDEEMALGDLEIEEISDNEIQRLISHPPTPSTTRRASPSAASSDSEDDFEAIPTAPPSAAPSGDAPPSARSKTVGEMDVALQKCRELAQAFREKHVLRIPELQFIDAAAYRRYTVIKTLAVVSGRLVAPVKPPVLSPVQKPSSLRAAGQAREEQTGRKHTPPPPPQSSGAAVVPAAGDDVVGALLGVMQAPGAKNGEQPAAAVAQQAQPTPADIPDDMLAAMQAIEGTVGGTKPRAGPPATPDEATLVPAGIRLPHNYSGPFSSLTTAEHARFLQLSRRQPRATMEPPEHHRLRQRVDAEQSEFRSRLRQRTTGVLQLCEPLVAEAGARILRRQNEHARLHYAAGYVAARVLAIRPVGSAHVPLVYRSTVAQRGTCYAARAVLDDAVLQDAVRRMVQEGADEVGARPVMSCDEMVGALAGGAQAHVAVCDEALAALLTLQAMHAHDVLVPVEVRELETAEGSRTLVIVDRPLVVGRAATPRRLRQLVYDAAVRWQTADRSGASGAVPLDPDSSSAPFEASYTVWELGGTRILVRCAIDAFHEPNEGGPRTTVTGAAKLEYFDPTASAEESVVAGDGRLMEDTRPDERLSWWLAAFLRGSPSQVWVAHVGPDGRLAGQARCAAAEYYPEGAQTPQQQPPTHALREILAELRRLPTGRYMLQHRRGAWDATVLRAVDEPAGERAAAVNLHAELATEPLDNDADYAPPVWRGLGPLHVPWTYPPADVPKKRVAAVHAQDTSGGALASGMRKRKKAKGKAKGKRSRKSQ
ncbi:hypothetical protein IW150_001748 [Coemansia sp. RSA 2607]|nr:hypothetical protein IW150_001748 [Coemansia sp. RSA 2607]KAJ2396659.1 hypothetical protein GGI05_001021 [Coemansia sp. RSA 2603]